MAHVAAPVELRRGGDEVELADVADQDDVEEPVVGARVGGELHPAAVPAAVREDHVVHPPAALAAVEADRRPRCSSRRRTRARARRRTSRGRRGPSTSSSPAARPRRSSRPSRRWRRAGSPRSVGAREARPGRGRPGATHRRARPRPRRRSGSGMPWVRPKSCPVPFGSTAISAAEPASPLTTSLSVPSPPTTTTQPPVRGDAARQLGQVPGRLREQRLAVEPELAGAPLRAPASASPVEPFAARRVDEEDGAGGQLSGRLRPRRRARASSSGRPPPSAPRR